jgi:nitrite reductase/ring-hydroxylating ferredoxin subunit
VGHIPVAKPSPIPRTLRFPRRGLAVACFLLAFVVLIAVIAAEAYPRGVKVDVGPQHWVGVMPASGLTVNQPVHVAEPRVWVVKQSSGNVLALYDVSPSVERCVINWRPDLLFRNQTGWLRSPCHGDTYDLSGTCVYECPRDMDRYGTRVSGGQVQIHTGDHTLIEGTVRDSSMTATHAANVQLAP